MEANLGRLEELSNAAKTVNIQIKSEILKLQGLKTASGTIAAAAAVSSPEYEAAKNVAEAAASKHGKDSKEAAVAWEAVFEIVSSRGSDKVNMGSLEDECLTSSSEKCMQYNAAMAELQKAISAQN